MKKLKTTDFAEVAYEFISGIGRNEDGNLILPSEKKIGWLPGIITKIDNHLIVFKVFKHDRTFEDIAHPLNSENYNWRLLGDNQNFSEVKPYLQDKVKMVLLLMHILELNK